MKIVVHAFSETGLGKSVYTYPITIEREGRKYWAYSEDFPGVYGLGNSVDEAKASILGSMRLYIEECRTDRRSFVSG